MPPRDAAREKHHHVEAGLDLLDGTLAATQITPETNTTATGTDNRGRTGLMHPVTIPPTMAGMMHPARATNKNVGIQQGGINGIDGKSRNHIIRTDAQVGGTKTSTNTTGTHKIRFQNHQLQQNRHRIHGLSTLGGEIALRNRGIRIATSQSFDHS